MPSPAPARWRVATDEVASRCLAGGLDLVHPFRVEWAGDALSGLLDADAHALALLVGNTRALWPALRAAVGADPVLRAAEHPVERHAAGVVEAALRAAGARYAVRYAHELLPRPLPIQRIAASVGLAVLSPSHLSVHPEHGPWIALRAVAVLEVEGPPGLAPQPVDPCGSCEKPCLPPLERAVAASRSTAGEARVTAHWRAWLAVRDACPVGRASRYSDGQIRYHYARERGSLGG